MIWLLLLGADVAVRPPWDLVRIGAKQETVRRALVAAGHGPTPPHADEHLLAYEYDRGHHFFRFDRETSALRSVRWFAQPAVDVAPMCKELAALRRRYGREHVVSTGMTLEWLAPGWGDATLAVTREEDGTWTARESHTSGDNPRSKDDPVVGSGPVGWRDLAWGMSLADAEATLWRAGYHVEHTLNPAFACGPDDPLDGTCGMIVDIRFQSADEEGTVTGHMLRGIQEILVVHAGLPTREAALAREPALRERFGPYDELQISRELGFKADDVHVRFTTTEEKLGGTWAWRGYIRAAE